MIHESPTAAYVSRLVLKKQSALAVAHALKAVVDAFGHTPGTRRLASLARRIEGCAFSFFIRCAASRTKQRAFKSAISAPAAHVSVPFAPRRLLAS